MTSDYLSSRTDFSFRIYGNDMQYVEIFLAPEKSVIAEPGSMIYKDDCVDFEASLSSNKNKGLLGRLVGAGKRVLSGERAFLSVFTNEGRDYARAAFAAPYPGKIVAIPLSDYNAEIICQKDSFLCAEPDTDISVFFQKKILTALFGGSGFIMQKLSGNGVVFINGGGSIAELELKHGETIQTDIGCLVAFTPSVDFGIEGAGGIKSQIFGGSGVFFATLRGPGKVWIQSLPFSRLVERFASRIVIRQK